MLKAPCLKNAHNESGIQRKVVSGHREQVHVQIVLPGKQLRILTCTMGRELASALPMK